MVIISLRPRPFRICEVTIMLKRSKIISAICVLALVLLLTVSCQGEPEAGNGVGDDGEEPMDNGRVVWETEIGITGLFKGVEFVVDDDRLYVVSIGEGLAEWDRFIEDPPKDKQEGVYCLDAETGEIIWHTYIGEAPLSDVAIYGERLYLYSRDSLVCMNADDGEIVWEYPLSQHINTESLAVSPEAVFVGYQDIVLAIGHDGKNLLWEATVRIRVRSLSYNDGRLYVGAEGKWEEVPAYLFCFDATTGEEIWRYEASDFHELDDPPVIVGDWIYLHSSEGRVHCLSLSEKEWVFSRGSQVDFLNLDAGGKLWVQDFAEWGEEDQCNYVNPMVGTPSVVDGKLYIGRSMNPGYVYCVDTVTGFITWKAKRYPDRPDARVTTAVAHSEGRLYYGWEGWKVETEGGHRSYACFSCISAEDGSSVWDFELDDRPATTPQAIGDKVYFGSANGYFYCLKAD